MIVLSFFSQLVDSTIKIKNWNWNYFGLRQSPPYDDENNGLKMRMKLEWLDNHQQFMSNDDSVYLHPTAVLRRPQRPHVCVV